jgi:NAD+ synthase (glutamine-hydrolysing)
MKIALCQINLTIGDFQNNTKKIIELINKSRHEKCQIVVFPELAVSGYPPLDLIENRDFIQQNHLALQKIINSTDDIAVILGSINSVNNKLYNSAFVIKNKEILHIQNKTLLPNYDVFDEKRYFNSGYEYNLININNLKIGVLICEDIWFDVYKDKYQIDPLQKIMQLNPDFLIVIAASPFSKNKLNNRISICKNINLVHNIPLIYLNTVGAQDEIIFDGNSFYVDAEYSDFCKSFYEDYKIIDLSSLNTRNILLNDIDNEIESIYDALVLGIKDYFAKTGINKAVIGISGGIDSAVVAPLTVAALGKENVIGLILPSVYNADSSLSDAETLAKNLGIKYHFISINNLFNNYKNDLKDIFAGYKEDVTEENIQSRIRGNLLMAVANKINGMVMTTGNKSEFSMGYATLYGDLIGGVAPLGDLLKRDVYKLGRFINNEKVIIPENIFDKEPSAELKPNQKDEDSLPKYKILDEILHLHIEKGCIKDEIINKGFDKDTVDFIFKKLYSNEFKRKQAPIVLKVSDKNFGIGRRIPITNNFY